MADGAVGTTNADLLLNDEDPDDPTPLTDTLIITEVGGDTASVGKAIDGSNGGSFTIRDDGSWEFDPDGDFDDLGPGENTPHHLGGLHRRREQRDGRSQPQRHPDGDGQRPQRSAGAGLTGRWA